MAFVHQPRWLRPIIEPLASTPTKSNPMPLRKLDPTCRLRGWQYFASEVDKMRVQLRHRGIEPILAGSRWNIPGELGFYCEGHPTVYCFGLAFGDRYSQYDLWHPNPIAEPEQFLGRTFIYEGGIAPIMKKAFDRFERTKVIRYEEDGQTISMWYVTICHGFKGFPEIDGNRY